ncbi:PspC domain-containing protein [Gordonia sp. 'Campus']|uniref:PspC domain-containing protein n=1 Tax=Gordonia sp. 'Campus' TaxID=2915824 RepID=UPI001EE4814A|nr:PspC domain-containing protein [Gordonia sp. 'Campus']
MTTAQPAHIGPRLMRSRDNAWLGGVCGGIAERWNWDPTLVRALFVLSILFPGPQVLIYLALWIVIPRRPAPATATPVV